MWLLPLVGGVVVVLVFLRARAESSGSTPPPPVLVAPPTPEADSSSAASLAEGLQTYQDTKTSYNNEGFATLIGSIGAGVAQGLKYSGGNAVGAIVGAIVGWFLWWMAWESGEQPVPPPIPWQSLALPYRPDWTVWEGGGARLIIPHPEDPFGTAELTFSRAQLLEAYPGEGALDACKRAGQICWRPHDTPTPFSALLYGAVPYLREYESQYLPRGPEDFSVEGAAFGWGNLRDVPRGDLNAVKRLVVAARRLAALRELNTPRLFEVKQSDTAALDSAGAATKLAPNAVVYCGSDIGTWLRYFSSMSGSTLNTRFENWRMVKILCSALDVGVWECSPRVHDQCSLRQIARGDPDAHRTAAGLFPGAWCLAQPGEVPTIGAAAVQGSSGSRMISTSTAPVMRTISPVQIGVAGGDGSDAADEFRFVVWTHRGREVVSSATFASIVGGHRAVLEQLTAGTLSWNPRRNSSAVRARWESVVPGMGQLFQRVEAGWVGVY